MTLTSFLIFFFTAVALVVIVGVLLGASGFMKPSEELVPTPPNYLLEVQEGDTVPETSPENNVLASPTPSPTI